MDAELVSFRKRKLSPYWSAPQVLENFLTINEVQALQDIHLRSGPKVKKPYNQESPLLWSEATEAILGQKLESVLGKFKISYGQFFQAFEPYWPHVDTGKSNEALIYKAIVIPLEAPRDQECHTVFFKQRYLGSAASFTKGKTIPLAYNDSITDYSQVIGVNKNTPIDEGVYDAYLDHAPQSVYEGLEVESVFQWKLGSVIIFDRCQLHCSGNFKKRGLTSKSGLSIFTELINGFSPDHSV